jgi:hypothetical protein
MRLGILIIGSLYWDHSPVRCRWRQDRLSPSGERRVRVPIRYGRKSETRGDTFTMVLATSCSSPAMLGTGIVVPTHANDRHPDHLIEEAEYLWAAEQNAAQIGGVCSKNWGAVCVLQNPKGAVPPEIMKSWEKRIQAAGKAYRSPSTANGEDRVLDAATGLALFQWPTDDHTKAPLSDFDLLLMTANEPTLNDHRYATAQEIAGAWSRDEGSNVLYFHNNRHHGITTFEDAQILSLLRNDPP